MTQKTMSVAGARAEVAGRFDEIVTKTVDALAEGGFGVLTRIDVRATLAEKIGAQVAPYVILGACMPRIAQRALECEPHVGLMMPCNVVVRETAADRSVVEAVDATTMAQAFPDAGLEELAGEVDAALRRVVAAVGGQAEL